MLIKISFPLHHFPLENNMYEAAGVSRAVLSVFWREYIYIYRTVTPKNMLEVRAREAAAF